MAPSPWRSAAEVERKLKAGELRAIVATHSLELGIDIGALDEVVLVQSPFSVSSAIQRVGRAGHRVGQISRGLDLSHPSQGFSGGRGARSRDPGPGYRSRQAGSLSPRRAGPGDRLHGRGRDLGMDSLFVHLRTSYPYRHLSREQFDLVLNMLAGRYAHTRIRELKPRVSIDRLDNTVAARKGALQALYSSGGVIPDRGYFHLRHQETRASIGELDEEFVWEASVGDTFALGTQNWQIRQITHNDVLVLPGPFQRGRGALLESGREWPGLSFFGADREIPGRGGRPPGGSCFPVYSAAGELPWKSAAAEQLIDFLKRQKKETGCGFPHRHHLVVEYSVAGPVGPRGIRW